VRVVPITIVGAHVFYPAGNAAPLAPARGVTIVVHPPLPPPENKKARACCCRRDRHLLRCRHAIRPVVLSSVALLSQEAATLKLAREAILSAMPPSMLPLEPDTVPRA